MGEEFPEDDITKAARSLAGEPSGDAAAGRYSYLFDDNDPSNLSIDAADVRTVEGRNLMLEQRLNDLTRPLPKVELVQAPINKLDIIIAGIPPPRSGDPKIGTQSFLIQSRGGEKVGYLVVKMPREPVDGKMYYYIGDIGITRQGKGYGPATYLEVLKSLPKNVGLRTQGTLSSDALAVWQGFVEKGIAKPSTLGGSAKSFETTF